MIRCASCDGMGDLYAGCLIVVASLFHIGFSFVFNPNLKTTYELVIDGISVMRGYCQLIDIRITNGKIDYVLNAKGAIGDLFSSIGDALVEDLDFSTYNHTWNRTNIEASWTPTLGQGYVYPMIDYGNKIVRSFGE